MAPWEVAEIVEEVYELAAGRPEPVANPEAYLRDKRREAFTRAAEAAGVPLTVFLKSDPGHQARYLKKATGQAYVAGDVAARAAELLTDLKE